MALQALRLRPSDAADRQTSRQAGKETQTGFSEFSRPTATSPCAKKNKNQCLRGFASVRFALASSTGLLLVGCRRSCEAVAGALLEYSFCRSEQQQEYQQRRLNSPTPPPPPAEFEEGAYGSGLR